jgi:hypothetical protein
MPRSEPDNEQEIDGRLEYVRGLLEGGELTDEERRERALARLTDLVAELTTEVGGLRAEVRELRASSQPPAGAAAAPEMLFCPSCGRELAIEPGALGRGPTEISCGHCRAILEVE